MNECLSLAVLEVDEYTPKGKGEQSEESVTEPRTVVSRCCHFIRGEREKLVSFNVGLLSARYRSRFCNDTAKIKAST